MEADTGASEQLVAQWEQQISDNAARYQQMADRVQQLSITETSKDGVIRVTVGANGILSNLVIAETARDRSMAELTRQIMTCLQRAQSKIPELLRQTMTETLGTQDGTANEILAQAQQTFPQPPPEEPPTGPGAPPVREYQFAPEDSGPPPPPHVPPPSHVPPPAPHTPPAPPRRPRPSGPDDDDWDGQSVLS